MKFKLNHNDAHRTYNRIIQYSKSHFLSNNLEEALKKIEVSAKWAYQLNFIYSDKSADLLLKSITKKIFNESEIEFSPIKDRCVLIDTNGSDNHGLTQQYIRALINSDIEFAYIYEDLDLNRITEIRKELKAYKKATFFSFDKNYSNVEKIKKIRDFILQFKPTNFLMHVMPWDIVAMAICSVLRSSKKYIINATDHTYWIGASLIDFSIEFRNYGSTITLLHRGISEDQIKILPYYPILNESKFLGFPKTFIKDPIKIFTGGAVYKIAGENNLFLQILKEIVINNPRAIIYFATGGSMNLLNQFIKNNHLENQIVLLNNRNDINQVFENCDIYLGTYPVSGGLMSQYASVNGKPILAYSDPKFPLNNIEDIICHNESIRDITKHSLVEFYDYANLLCQDEKFRKAEGDRLLKCVISINDFNNEFISLLNNENLKRKFNLVEINNKHIIDLYLDVENSFYPTAQVILFREFRLKTFFLSKKIFINMTLFIIKKFTYKIIRLNEKN